jgi:RimJ/RimL family protein N-acetyltransferase
MQLSLRFATIREVDIYYKWASDPLVRRNSYTVNEISYENHVSWFSKKLLDKNCFLYFFEFNNIPAGQVRIDKSQAETVIGISVDENFRGKSLSSKMLVMASENFFQYHAAENITAYIKQENKSSYHSFLKAGFVEIDLLPVNEVMSYKLIKKSNGDI